MPVQNIVIKQKTNPTLVQRARELRREMTEEEKILWHQLRANRLHGFHFRRQQVIGKSIVDFYCHSAGLVVEVDGDIHQQRVERDTERDGELVARGLRVLRFKNQEIKEDLSNVLACIVDVCHGKA